MQQFADLAAIEKALQDFWPSRVKRQGHASKHMADFMEYLGNPQEAARTIHIAGTSGKTSTAYYTAALLTQAHRKTGLLVSPHIERLNERVQVNGAPLPEALFCSEFSKFFALFRQSQLPLMFTEVLYGFAFWEFARLQVEVNVIETGVGGLLDATNVIMRHDKICVLTDIGYDHMNLLGTTLPEIAMHKAGIIGLKNEVFCYQQSPEIMQVINRACREKQACLHSMTNLLDANPAMPLFQQRNFGLALATVSFLLEAEKRDPLSREQTVRAAATYIPGRMEQVSYQGKTLIFDAAHNTQKLQALTESIQAAYPGTKLAVLAVFVAGRGRDVQKQLAALAPICTSFITTDLPVEPISWQPSCDVVAAAQQVGLPNVRPIADYHEALAALLQQPEDVVLITGSLYAQHYFRQNVPLLSLPA